MLLKTGVVTPAREHVVHMPTATQDSTRLSVHARLITWEIHLYVVCKVIHLFSYYSYYI